MRVLIVSHNVLCQTTNNGKTMLSYFRDFAPEDVAQFYFHSEVPTDGETCCRYYRMTDHDALKSIFRIKKYGTRFGAADIRTDLDSARTDTGLTRKLYRIGHKRGAAVYALRNAVWKLSKWDTPEFWAWAKEFDPDVIFFVFSDYTFSCDIARIISQRLDKPLVAVCVDDFYFYNRNADSALGRWAHRNYQKAARRAMDQASMVFTICASMKDAYEKEFGKPCRVLHTPAQQQELTFDSDAEAIAYIGNLDFGRHLQLVDIGRALLPKGRWVDVYSQEDNPEILKYLTPENGICFHGPVSANQVLDVMRGCMAVIHTESFDSKMRSIVRYSVSTKVAESLMYGPCMIAYGPEDVASMDYLRSTGSAYVINSADALPAALERFLSDSGLRQDILCIARQTAQENHSPDVNSARIRQWLTEVCEVKE